jgi:hypothetical protein
VKLMVILVGFLQVFTLFFFSFFVCPFCILHVCLGAPYAFF